MIEIAKFLFWTVVVAALFCCTHCPLKPWHFS